MTQIQVTGTAFPSSTAMRIGRVVANTGRDVLIIVDSHIEKRPAIRIGDIVLLQAKRDVSVGIVSGINAPAPGIESDGEELWIVQVELVGRFEMKDGTTEFLRGAPAAPTLGSPVHLAGVSEIKLLHRHHQEDNLNYGMIQGHDGVQATIDPQGLMDGGFGILGGAGSGKSSTMACIVRTLLRARYPVHSLLIDPYNEFSRSFGRAANVIEPSPGLFPHWLLTFEEMVWVLSLQGGALSEIEKTVLDEAIPIMRRSFAQRNSRAKMSPDISGDSPVPYRISDLISYIDKAASTGREKSADALQRLRARILEAVADPRLSIIFGNAATSDNLSDLMVDLFRLDGGAPLSVLQLGRLAAGLDRLVVAVVSRLAAALAEWSGLKRQILILIDNAERYAPVQVEDEVTAFSREALRMLGGRPRKLGTSLGLTAAGPRVVDLDVLLRCSTIFLHRMPSALDGEAVEEILTEPAPTFVDGLPSLRQREVMVAGRGVPLPSRVMVTELPAIAIPGARPVAALTENALDDLEQTIERWRRYGTGEPSSETAA